ncbi:MAG: helix-turn-helix transcriptional regulator [Xanthomonadales bacterium]|nr:helix-turn-helix transcriptional regulator [Xanthomonadales bacterium]
MSGSETQRLIDSLKQVLRNQGITYAQVARHLGVSEATVKRMFSRAQMTLDRLEAIARFAGVSIADLAQLSVVRPAPVTRLTPEQERELIGDSKLLLVTYMVLNGWSVDQITDTFEMTEPEVIKRLVRLDRLGMIELLPGNRIRRLVARNFSWRTHGPVEQFFESEVKRDFLDSRFGRPGEHMRFLGGLVSRDSVRRMHAEIDALTAKLDEFIQADLDLPLEDKFGIGAVFALRPWELPVFAKLRRKPIDKKF